MAEYIEREALISEIQEEIDFETTMYTEEQNKYFNMGLKCALRDVKRQPSADVVEVRHGEWNIKSEIHQMFDDVDEEFFVECPFCQRRYHVPFEFEDGKILEYAREEYPYCHCGAKMDGKGGDPMMGMEFFCRSVLGCAYWCLRCCPLGLLHHQGHWQRRQIKRQYQKVG